MLSNMSNGQPPLIGLVGPAGSGKDTIAEHLVEHHGFVRVAFADRLREFAARIDPVFAALCAAHGGYETAKRAHSHIRNRMIEVGNAARDIIGGDVWIDAVEDTLVGLTGDEPVVITDVRFLNEAEWIEDSRGTIVSVQRPDFSLSTSEERAISATAELYVENDGDLHQLRERVDMLAEDFLL